MKKVINLHYFINTDHNRQTLEKTIKSELTSNQIYYDFDQYKQEFLFEKNILKSIAFHCK